MNSKIGRNDPCYCGSGKKYKFCHANQQTHQSSPTPEIASYVINPKSKQITGISKSIVLNHLRRDSLKIAESFDNFFKNDVEQISAEMARSWGVLTPWFQLRNEDGLTAEQEVCFPLLVNSYHSILASLELLRNGYRLQPGILIRSIVESLCEVLYLVRFPNEIARFKAGKLDSQSTIGSAKDFLPIFGELYGFFSKRFTHMGEFHKKPNPLIPYEKGDESAEANLLFIRMAVSLHYIVTELVFLDLIVDPRYWRRLTENAYSYCPSDAERDRLNKFCFPTESTNQPTV